MNRERVLTVNVGSSSIKFAVFDRAGENEDPTRVLSGKVDRIDSDETELGASSPDGHVDERVPLHASDHADAANQLLDWLSGQTRGLAHEAPVAVGHRVVHGGAELSRHQPITDGVLDQLRRIQSLDLDHLPLEIRLIETCRARFPQCLHVACFDTVFHRELPARARLLPIPSRFLESGVRRFGFHGLSYAYLLRELERRAGEAAARGRLVLAHLGSGASLAAVRNGRPVDTTMGFTPTSGLVMSTRPGDLDPGLLVHLMQSEELAPEQLGELISHECGLRGMTGTRGDMRELLAERQRGDPSAAEAVELFCYQVQKGIGAFAAALGGLETLIFAGGIGEKAPEVRSAVCRELGHLGVHLDVERNQSSADVISARGAPVTVHVIPTDEELTMVRIVEAVLSRDSTGGIAADRSG
jgi:acetate kinase